MEMTNESQYPVLIAESLCRSLGTKEVKTQVLADVSLNLFRANTYAIVGPSGCGKSTLLYLLGLLDRPDKGKIWIQNELATEGCDERRTNLRNQHIGFVFQFHFLLPEFTVMENVLMPMKKKGKEPLQQMKDRARSLLNEVGLGDKTHRLATQLSGGEQQRVAIARALGNSPSLILADEPTGNLDQKNSYVVFDLLYRFAHEKKQAVLIVTHNPEIAEKCDHILSMKDGSFN